MSFHNRWSLSRHKHRQRVLRQAQVGQLSFSTVESRPCPFVIFDCSPGNTVCETFSSMFALYMSTPHFDNHLLRLNHQGYEENILNVAYSRHFLLYGWRIICLFTVADDKAIVKTGWRSGQNEKCLAVRPVVKSLYVGELRWAEIEASAPVPRAWVFSGEGDVDVAVFWKECCHSRLPFSFVYWEKLFRAVSGYFLIGHYDRVWQHKLVNRPYIFNLSGLRVYCFHMGQLVFHSFEKTEV